MARDDRGSRYMGGQAVLEGVMMRGPEIWAVAVRRADGSITTTTSAVSGWSERYRRVPVVRGVTALAESLALGYRALAWSAERQIDDHRGDDPDAGGDLPAPGRVLPVALVVALVFFTALFIVLPALLGHFAARHAALPAQVAESVVRIAFFVGYLALVGRMADIRRVFQFHGAEHKAIAAFERGVEVTPASAQRFTTAHVRCGTNFLLTVMLVAIVVYAAVPTPSLLAVIASRVVLIPLIAGVSYEVIRVAADHMDRGWVRVVMAPGLLLQRLTTREPSLDQLEVAIAALRACMTADQRAEVDARVAA
jgi:uncharacterized protein YqhQ